MSVSRLALLSAIGGFAIASHAVLAAPLVEETFDYDTGGIGGENGGTGFAGAWTNTKNNPNVTDPGLTWGDLDVQGGYLRGAAWSGAARQIDGSLAGAGLLADGSTLWFSVLFGMEGQGTTNADLSFALTDADKFVSGTFGDRKNLQGSSGAPEQGIGIAHEGGNIRGVYWQQEDSDDVLERTLSAASTTTIDGTNGPGPDFALIVGKIDWTDTGETLTLYAPGTDLSLGAPIVTFAIPNLNQASFDTIALQFKDQSQQDEIRFGATSADVLPAVPEPGSLALLGLGGLLIARRRRG